MTCSFLLKLPRGPLERRASISGAGAHKSAKDYKRQEKHKNKEKLGYYPKESISSKLDRLVLLERMQENCNSPSLWFSYEEEIMQIKEELQDVDF